MNGIHGILLCAYVFVRGTEVLQIIIAGLQGIVNNFFCKMYPVDFLYNLLYNVTVFVDFLCNSFMDAKELQNGVIVMNKKEKNILRAFVMVSQVSITILVPIALSGWIGWWLNGQFHTQIWFLIMIVLGVGAAFRNVYYLTKSFYSEDMKKEHERLQYIEALKKQGQARRGQTENASGEQKDADKKN